jgi:hypothetical protein
VLVLDVADHRLEQVLQRRQPVHAAELVDHQRHVHARALHPQQQVRRAHRRRHVQRLSPQPPQHRRVPVGGEADPPVSAGLADQLHHVLDVDHPHRVIQRLPIDRQARVLDLGEQSHHFAERRAHLHRQ